MDSSTEIHGILEIHRQDDNHSNHCYGSKGLRLRELAKLGYEVPDGFLISVECMSWLVKILGMDQYVSRIVASEASGESNLEAAVRDRFRKIEPEEHIFRSFMQHIENIRGFNPKMLLAVRSAAVGEDDSATSYAGQYSTVLGVFPKNLLNAIFECYASWWSDRVLVYRRQQGIDASKPHLSVIVQRQLLPDFAGVLFTQHPLSGHKDLMVLEAVAGLGDKLVSGEVTPSRWEFCKKSGTFSCLHQESSSPKIHEKYLRQLYHIGQRLENHFGHGMDMEWAIEKDRVFVLQARPITQGKILPETVSSASIRTQSNWAKNIYSRAIVEDLWADRMTNITGSIVFDEFADFFTFKTLLRKLKLHDIADMDAVKVINGYGYLSSQAIAQVLELIPRAFRFKELSRMFPVSLQHHVLKTPFNWKKAIRLIPRIPLILNDPAIIPLFTRSCLKKHLKNIEDEMNRVDVLSYSQMDLDELGLELERVLRLQAKLQERNQWGYGNAAIFTWMLRHLAINLFKKSEQWVLEQISHVPSNVTVLSQKQLNNICRMCDETILEKAFKNRNGKDSWEILSRDFPLHPVTQAIRSFVKTFKYRSANRDFIHPRWDEAPEIVVSMMSVMIGALENKSKKDSGVSAIIRNDSFQIRNTPEKRSSVILGPIVNATRNFLALREDLRFCLDKIFYRIRKILIAISQTPQCLSLNKNPDSIFFMTLGELRAILSGKLPMDQLHPLIKTRRQSYYQDQDQPPAYCIRMDKDSQTIISAGEQTSDTLWGIPASAGVAEGLARVIRHPHEFHLLNPGEILVAFNTDPGWTPLFMSAAGVIVEMGGILNHCAIVAREYGIPAVVGIEKASQKIETGRKIRLDGNAGLVELLH